MHVLVNIIYMPGPDREIIEMTLNQMQKIIHEGRMSSLSMHCSI